jgi:ATP synthase protein I
LLASRLVTPKKKPPLGGDSLCANTEISNELKPSIDSESLANNPKDSVNEYVLLQQRIFKMTLVVTAFLGLLTIIFVDFNAAISLFLGAFSGILYLRLLAKSIGSLGKNSTSVSKVQLLVPVLLVLVVTKLPEFQLIPALVGFLLYKPSLVLQFWFEQSA